MSKFRFIQWYGIAVCLLIAACTDVDITMPKGPKGDTGLSAYEFWKEKVADGTVDWPKDRTEVADFFKYLKGNDGKDGKSAFDQWKDMIADGNVDNPHNPAANGLPATIRCRISGISSQALPARAARHRISVITAIGLSEMRIRALPRREKRARTVRTVKMPCRLP